MNDIKVFVYPVEDLDAAKALYARLLGCQPYVESPYYVGFRVGGQEIGLDPNARSRGITMPIGYWDVENLEETIASLQSAGAQSYQEPTDVGGGLRIAVLKDQAGNLLGLRAK